MATGFLIGVTGLAVVLVVWPCACQTGDKCPSLQSLPTQCSKMTYNVSSFPNALGQVNAGEASMALNQFYPLVKIQCSDVLDVFLCSVYFPKCDSEIGNIPPCRETCDSARLGCETVMNKFGFTWPSGLNCNNFPSLTSNIKCMNFESNMTTTTTSTTTTKMTTTTMAPKANLPDFCRNLPYSKPSLPNILGHQTFGEARRNIDRFTAMMASGCSDGLTRYMCLLHYPTKDPSTQKPIPPCWEFCLAVRTWCLFKLPVPWPRSFFCENLPSKITPGARCWGYDMRIYSAPKLF
ncbi:frizzled-7-B-like [Haliotis rubra]|uniref:frizzled-7-B-like n=1 Tax=Haliotis rubra TaxID=36100 RepID=UPI001EE53753|nr:frizzled-7-B-like [Haliotis rubra]